MAETTAAAIVSAIVLGSFSLLAAVVAGVVAFVSAHNASKDIEGLRIIIGEQTQQIKAQGKRIEDLEAMNSDLEEWAERLTCQVKEAHLEPAKFIRHSEQVTQHQHKRNTE